MPVIGMSFSSIEAKVKSQKKGKIEVSSTPIIKNIEKKVEPIGEVASIEFEFKTTYNPGIAQISLKGEILLQERDINKLIKQWKDKKKLPAEIAVPVLNVIFRRCLKRAIDLADDLQLPPPIQFPVVKAKEDSKYIE